MQNNPSIKTSYKELYAAVRAENVLELIATLSRTRATHGVMSTCNLSEKAHFVFQKETEIRRHESLSERLATYKRQKQFNYSAYIKPKVSH